MNKSSVAVVVTSYNCPRHIEGFLKSMAYQTYKNFFIVVADDGSTDETLEVIRSYENSLPIDLLALPHGERGIARAKAMAAAIDKAPAYLFFIDGDMLLNKTLLESAVTAMAADPVLDGLIVEEKPYSNYSNYFTKVKVFERQVLNNDRSLDIKHSIEAARFWRCESYVATGGLNPKQIAFEEIQPTLRCLAQGGKVGRLSGGWLYHDEKKVTLMNLLEKKNYYFSQMSTTLSTESHGIMKAFSRWYLFRKVYYRKENLKAYIRHPLLFMGMILMYGCLTANGLWHVGKYSLGQFYRKEGAL